MAFNDQERQIIEYGKANGKSPDEIMDAVYRHRNGIPGPSQMREQTQEQGVGERVGAVIDAQGQKVREAITGEGEWEERGRVARGFGAAGEAAMAVPGAAIAATPEPVRKGLGWVGEKFMKGFDAVTGRIAETQLFQDIGRLEAEGHISKETTPGFYALKDALSVAKSSGEVADVVLMAEGAAKAGHAGAKLAGVDDITNVPLGQVPAAVAARGQRAVQFVDRTGHSAVQQGMNMRTKLQEVIGGKNADPKLAKSVERLTDTKGVAGASRRLDDPLTMYDDYVKMSQDALLDQKVDPAIAKVGSKIGDSFKEVVDQRRAVGKVMGSEVKKFGNKRVDLAGQVAKFQDDLIESGARYDAVTGKVTLTDSSKFTNTDLKLLQNYADDLKKLGNKPTAAQVEAFNSRMPNELKLARQKAGVPQMTNAERIANNSIRAGKGSFDKVATPEYIAARNSYSDLSKFIDEGSGYLGKVTQAGDFSKDASLAKSSVQSILNNGKKDWLIQLEELTGYPALDDSVLALQAMKDVGDYRGLSLLETMADGATPTSASGVRNQILQYSLEKGTEVVAGDPTDATRAYIQSITE